jgi:nucleotide-binding universal stress UspA family protein
MTRVPVRTILVPTDFSGGAAHALVWAQELARAFHSTIVLLHVVDLALTWMPVGPASIPEPVPADVADRITVAARESLANLARDAEGTVHRLVRRGHARQVILDVAKEVGADLIVIGARGHRDFSDLVIGSIAEYVVRHASVPVMTTRAPS